MVVHQSVDAHAIATRFAREVRNEPSVRELWLHESPDMVDLWLITGSIDDETELALYAKSGSLYDAFPGERFRVHVLHPAMFIDGADLRTLLARGSKRIPLQP